MEKGLSYSNGFNELDIFPGISYVRLCMLERTSNAVCKLTNSCTPQVFFRAGVLGQLEELRDERLAKIITWLQAWIRAYISRKEYKKLQDQRRVHQCLVKDHSQSVILDPKLLEVYHCLNPLAANSLSAFC